MLAQSYIVNVEGAVYWEGRYLMIVRGPEERQDPNTLSMPGGKVETQDNLQDVLEESLRREIMEETSVEICDEIEYVESKAFIANTGLLVVDIVFLCCYKSGQPTITDHNEVADIHWMRPDEILGNDSIPQWTRQSIERAEALRKARHLKNHFQFQKGLPP